MQTNFDTVATDIARRQYLQPGEEIVEDMLLRVSNVLGEHDEHPRAFSRQMYRNMVRQEFCPGGRILAGAGTEHGNLLNCFVQDGSPFEDGTTEWVLNLARKLAVVTKVGGGNGLNLDSIAPRGTFMPPTGRVFITINESHKDYNDVRAGRYLDLQTGERTTFGYKEVIFIPQDIAPRGNVIRVPDDTQGIWLAAEEMVKSVLEGEDVVVDLSDLRSEGSPVRGSGGESSGPASFAVEVFDNFALWASLGGAAYAGPVATLRYVFGPTLRVIRQGGTRRGAGMATLSITHPDIMDFVTAKDLDREEREGSIGTFNISVLVGHEFMGSAMLPGHDRELLGEIAAHAHATGEPGLIFIDTLNENNALLESDGPIMATNPCGEVPLYPGEPCDLGAINLASMVRPDDDNMPVFDWEYLETLTGYAVQALDNVLSAEKSPLPQIMEAIKDKRRIGLGVMGLGDALILMGIPYGSQEAQEFAEKVASTMAEAAIAKSTELAAVRGIPEGVKRAGLDRRNIALLTVAPTGTTSMLFGVTSGIEPLYSPLIYRRVGTDTIEMLHPLFKEMLMQYGVPEESELWPVLKRQISENHGSVQGLDLVPERVQKLFLCAHDVTPAEHVAMQAAFQAGYDWTEGGEPTYAGNSISKTINLPHSATVTDVLQSYTHAWQWGCKGVTVYRDGSRSLQVLNTSKEEDDVLSEAEEAMYCSLDGHCDS